MSKNKLAEMISDNMRELESSGTSQSADEPGARTDGTRRIKSAKWIPIQQISPDPTQPRRHFKASSLAELAQSIKEYGIRQPIVVEHTKERASFRIVSGERRYRASRMVGLQEMPCIVQGHTDQPLRFVQQLIENIHREDFSPIDKARALLEYKEILGNELPWSAVEEKIGISETRRKQFVALLNLPEQIQSEIIAIGKRPAKNQFTEKHARALLVLNKMPDQQAELFSVIMNAKAPMTGDEAMVMARSLKGAKTMQVFKVTYRTEEELITQLEQALSELRKSKKRQGAPR